MQLASPEPTASKSETETQGGGESEAGGQALLDHRGERSRPGPPFRPPCWNVLERCWPHLPPEPFQNHRPDLGFRQSPASPRSCSAKDSRKENFAAGTDLTCLNPANLMLQTGKLSPAQPVPKGRKMG